MVVDEQSNFKEDNFNTAMSVLKTAGDAAKGDSGNVGRKGGTKGESNCYKIVKMIMEKQMQPVIVFSFSRKECEAYGMQMSKLDFNSEQEKTLVEEIFNNAMDQLTEADKQLPQVWVWLLMKHHDINEVLLITNVFVGFVECCCYWVFLLLARVV